MIERLWAGVYASPSDALRDFSCLRFATPAASAIGLPFGAMTMSSGTPCTKFVIVELKYCCCSDGALKPPLTDPRNSSPSLMRYEDASLPICAPPKSL